jgi:hypothetical protein
MSDERFCRRCLLFESGREDILTTVRQHIEKIPEADRSDDNTYQRRLALCVACEQLVDGTCLRCGCYPEFRAAFWKQSCPAKKW